MIRLTLEAPANVAELTQYCADRGRDGAIDRLAQCLERAGNRISGKLGISHLSPRPYPALTRNGWQWINEGPYWIAFTRDEQGQLIRAVFHEAADIANRV